MLKNLKNTIIVLLVFGAVGVITNLIEGPDKNWVYEQISAHGGTVEEMDKDRIEYRIGNTYTSTTWERAEKHFKDLND